MQIGLEYVHRHIGVWSKNCQLCHVQSLWFTITPCIEFANIRTPNTGNLPWLQHRFRSSVTTHIGDDLKVKDDTNDCVIKHRK